MSDSTMHVEHTRPKMCQTVALIDSDNTDLSDFLETIDRVFSNLDWDVLAYADLSLYDLILIDSSKVKVSNIGDNHKLALRNYTCLGGTLLFIGSTPNEQLLASLFEHDESSRFNRTELPVNNTSFIMTTPNLIDNPPDIQLGFIGYGYYIFWNIGSSNLTSFSDIELQITENALDYPNNQLQSKVEFLSNTEVFKTLEQKQLEAIAKKMFMRWHANGDQLCAKGDIGTELFIIKSGQVDVMSDDGRIVAEITQGNYVGELSVLASIPRTATIKAQGICELLIINAEDFKDLVRTDAQLGLTLLSSLALRYSAVAGK